MGIVGKIVGKMVLGAAQAVGADVAKGTLDVVEKGIEVTSKGIEKGVEITSKANELAKNTVTNIREKHNLSQLKKETNEEDQSLFVHKENELGFGIYKVTNSDKVEKYNTLLEQGDGSYFDLYLYSYEKGEIASAHRIDPINTQRILQPKFSYFLQLHGSYLGIITERFEARQKVYSTDFNDWIITGNYKEDNYKIFSKSNGRTIASISKKHKRHLFINWILIRTKIKKLLY